MLEFYTCPISLHTALPLITPRQMDPPSEDLNYNASYHCHKQSQYDMWTSCRHIPKFDQVYLLIKVFFRWVLSANSPKTVCKSDHRHTALSQCTPHANHNALCILCPMAYICICHIKNILESHTVPNTYVTTWLICRWAHLVCYKKRVRYFSGVTTMIILQIDDLNNDCHDVLVTCRPTT